MSPWATINVFSRRVFGGDREELKVQVQHYMHTQAVYLNRAIVIVKKENFAMITANKNTVRVILCLHPE